MRHLSLAVVVNRALWWYARATPAEQLEGRFWYSRAAHECTKLADRYNVPYTTVAAVVAILSPGVRWSRNLVEAEAVLSLDPEPRHTAFSRNVAKAHRLVNGNALEDVLSSRKVTAFYRALCLMDGPPVIDSTMICALALGRPMPLTTSADAGRYFDRAIDMATMSEALCIAAFKLQIPTNALQATIWLVYRGMRDSL